MAGARIPVCTAWSATGPASGPLGTRGSAGARPWLPCMQVNSRCWWWAASGGRKARGDGST
eukprot:15395623-Alexandrium_andersonii.AAC.1